MTSPDSIAPWSDLAFKKALGAEDNKDILQGFIADIFGVKPDLDSIQVVNPYSIKTYTEYGQTGQYQKLRQTLRDVTATFGTGDFTAEIQIKRTNSFERRSIYYAFDLYNSHYNPPEAKPDDRYRWLRPVWSVNILGWNHFDDEDALRIMRLCDPERNKYFATDPVRIAYLELHKSQVDRPEVTWWQSYFRGTPLDNAAPDYLRKANDMIELINLSSEERYMVDLLEKYEADEQALRITIEEEARAEGFHEAGVAHARNALKMGLSPQQVSEITGLSPEEVAKLLAQ
jgi:predicted transposase/invertase (TIGR01784 family)